MRERQSAPVALALLICTLSASPGLLLCPIFGPADEGTRSTGDDCEKTKQPADRGRIAAAIPGYSRHGIDPFRAGIRAVQSTPLVSRSGRLVGMFSTHYKQPYRPDERTLRFLDLLSRQAADIIEYLQSREEREKTEIARKLESKLREVAEKANRSKDEFIAILSHELRTPLNSILGWIQLVNRYGREPARLDQALPAIEQSARVQSQIISDMLDITRIDAGKLNVMLKNIEISHVVNSAIESMLPAARAGHITLEKRFDASLPTIKGDARRIQQCVWNLLSNAIKFTPEGGKVSVRLEAVGEWITISVKDDGKGIEPELLPHIFERYCQGDSSNTRQHGGLGLGLTIVKNLVELHDGKIEATSEGRNRGSTFIIMLPCKQVYEQQSAKAVTADLNEVKLAGLSMLIVDDNRRTRFMLRHLLENRGAIVLTAASAEEALNTLKASKPDLLICDIAMPVRSGYDLLQEVRRLSTVEGGDIPAIALTASAREDDRVQSSKAGFQAHLTKPVELEELLPCIVQLTQSANRAKLGCSI